MKITTIFVKMVIEGIFKDIAAELLFKLWPHIKLYYNVHLTKLSFVRLVCYNHDFVTMNPCISVFFYILYLIIL